MTFQKTITIKANSQGDADKIAEAMSKMSGTFSAKEWETISKKLSNKLVQMRLRLLIQ